jgi:hypothetical protein
VVGERQLLPAMQVHRRGERDVGDRGRGRACDPVVLREPRVEDAGELVEVLGLPGEHLRVGGPAEQRLDAVLDEEHVARREPARRLPEQPAVHVGARAQVGGIGRRVADLVSRVLQDRVRLPQHEVAVLHRGDRRVGIQREVGVRLLLALEVVDVLELVRGADELEPGEHLAAVDGDRVGVDLHRGSPQVCWDGDRAPPATQCRRLDRGGESRSNANRSSANRERWSSPPTCSARS